jgi:uncharacterized protein GlcG (DUF336 family)
MRTAPVALGALFLSLALPSALPAQEMPRVPALPLELAQKVAVAALEQCEADGYQVSVAVVDAGGDLKALLRADGAGPHTPDSSFKKAYTAASLGRPTGELAQLIVDQPAAQGLRDMNESILILGGGLPIKTDGGVAGGIGVGGAPGGHLDEACARAGLEAMSGG